MATADEIMIKQMVASGKLDSLMEDFTITQRIFCNDILRRNYGRIVHAKRARKLRRSGRADIRFIGKTSTGKHIFRWMPKLSIYWEAKK